VRLIECTQRGIFAVIETYESENGVLVFWGYNKYGLALKNSNSKFVKLPECVCGFEQLNIEKIKAGKSHFVV